MRASDFAVTPAHAHVPRASRPSLLATDLKPENLLLDAIGNIKMADFGWAINTEAARQTFCGTLDYLAPEMVNQDTYGPSIDVWALGVLIYEFLCGQPPFAVVSEPTTEHLSPNNKLRLKAEQRATMKRIDSVELPDPALPEASAEVNDLIKKLLVKDSKQRLTIQQVLEHPWVKAHAQ